MSWNLFQMLTGIGYSKKGMRAELSYISKRYRKAINKCLKSYNPNLESKHIIFLYANNF